MVGKADRITLEVLTDHFHLPMAEVAKKFDVCVTFFKRICRARGILRWPYRKLKSLEKQALDDGEATLSPGRRPSEADAVTPTSHNTTLRQRQEAWAHATKKVEKEHTNSAPSDLHVASLSLLASVASVAAHEADDFRHAEHALVPALVPVRPFPPMPSAAPVVQLPLPHLDPSSSFFRFPRSGGDYNVKHDALMAMRVFGTTMNMPCLPDLQRIPPLVVMK